MGQEKNKLNVQKQQLKKVLKAIIDSNMEIMRFQLTLTNNTKEIEGLKHFIKESEKSKKIIDSVVHYEILVSLYNSFINGKEIYFLTVVRTINKKNTIQKWDRSEKGFKDFLEQERIAKAKSEEEAKKKAEKQEIIRKAREEGKKIEMVYIDGELQPSIVEEKPN